ncbi:MAG: DEAD/DEAH box helicase [archaeon]
MEIEDLLKTHPGLEKVVGILRQSGVQKLYPPQAECFSKKVLDGKNLVLSIPTASGKTLVAEIVMMQHVLAGKKAVYLVPLRALASEKYQEFREKYSGLCRVGMSSGDYDRVDAGLGACDIIILTIEKMDSLMRHDVNWLSKIGVVVVDEIHLLDSPDRGPTLEMVITKLRKYKPSILALSATIENSDELAQWLGAELVESDFRPVRLSRGVFLDGKVSFDIKEDIELNDEGDISLVLAKDTVLQGGQSLVFVNSRRSAEAEAEKISKSMYSLLGEKERKLLAKAAEDVLGALETPTKQCKRLANCIRGGAAFHHAGLHLKQRAVVESSFKANLIKVVSATPTLAAGVNLPAKRVVIRDYKRYTSYGLEPIPVLEIHQMCLPYTEKILLGDGSEEEIGRLVEDKKRIGVLSYNQESDSIEPKKIERFYKSKSRHFVDIEVSIGHKLRLTPDHPVLVFNNGKKTWKRACKLKKMDMVLCQNTTRRRMKSIPYFYEFLNKDRSYLVGRGELIKDARERLRCTEKELAKSIGASYRSMWHYKTNRKAMPAKIALELCKILELDGAGITKVFSKVKTAYGNTIKLPPKISEDYLWLCGLIATDGNLQEAYDRCGSRYCKIRIFNNNRKIINRATSILREFNLEPCCRKVGDKCHAIEVGATLLADIISINFGIPYGNKTAIVRVPDIVKSMPPAYIGSYLAGVFDGDGNYFELKKSGVVKGRRVLFSTGSKQFADGIQKLLTRIGITSTVRKERGGKTFGIRGKLVTFPRANYTISFCKKEYINRFHRFVRPVKCSIPAVRYSDYHNINKFFDRPAEYSSVPIKRIRRVELKDPVTAYNLGVKDNNNYIASNILVHNCGRAGRPKYDSDGEAVLIAKSLPEYEQLWEHYIEGRPEPISSKLGVEPILRTHILGIISQGPLTRESLDKMFESTFYAFQYGDVSALEEIISRVLDSLFSWGFLEEEDLKFRCTRLGKRVAELYIDPLTAYEFIRLFETEMEEMVLLTMISDTSEMGMLPGVRSAEEPFLYEEFEKYSLDEDKIRAFKNALVFRDWMDEKTEDDILERHNVAPGILKVRLDIADWLLYSCVEINAILKRNEAAKMVRRLRTRLSYGVKEELSLLVRVRGIGRVRARRLFSAGIKKPSDLNSRNCTKVSNLLGKKTAEKIYSDLRAKISKRGVQ